MRRAILVAVALSCFVVGDKVSAAEAVKFYDGNKLWDYCKVAEDPRRDVALGFCSGYVTGVADASDERLFCLPIGMQNQQVTDLVTLWLRDHPEKRHFSAADLVTVALKEKFPCN